MVKSSSPIFVLLFAFLFGLERPTWTLTAIILAICGGVALMVYDAPEFNATGFAQVQAATVLAGLRWSITQILLQDETMGMNNPLAASLFLSPVMAICLGVMSAAVEGGAAASAAAAHTNTLALAVMVVSGGLLAFLMLTAELLLISVTSVVTFSVAGICKELLTIVASAAVFGDRPFTPARSLGLAVSIAGVAAYNVVRAASPAAARHRGHGHGGPLGPASADGDVELSADSRWGGAGWRELADDDETLKFIEEEDDGDADVEDEFLEESDSGPDARGSTVLTSFDSPLPAHQSSAPVAASVVVADAVGGAPLAAPRIPPAYPPPPTKFF
ncbi:hypothetical protein HK405_001574 [Cladochytrium tenue]|nr:hypothetical protein HK405_001574 [Cladochytrium tenue]